MNLLLEARHRSRPLALTSPEQLAEHGTEDRVRRRGSVGSSSAIAEQAERDRASDKEFRSARTKAAVSAVACAAAVAAPSVVPQPALN